MAFRRRRHRAFRRASRLGIVAVLLQIIVPAIHHPAAAPTSQLSLLFPDAVICSASGTTVPDKDHGKPAPRCPICWALQQLAGGYTAPAVMAGPQCSFGAGITNRLAASVPSLVSIPRQAAQPRGPPRLA